MNFEDPSLFPSMSEVSSDYSLPKGKEGNGSILTNGYKEFKCLEVEVYLISKN